MNAPTKSACRTCGLPKNDHEQDRHGTVRLKASVRAVVGNRLPDVCWTKEQAMFGDLYNRRPFMARVQGRKIA